MKTKILLLMAGIALIVNSCSSEIDEETSAPDLQKVEKTEKADFEAIKTNSNNREETSKVSDSIDIPDHQFSTPPNTGLDPNPDPSPNDPGTTNPIVDPTKPPKPW